MRILLSILAILAVGCSPELETPNVPDEEEVVLETDEIGDTSVEEPEPEELVFGFLETTDCGWNIGDDSCNFRLLDQDGEPWELAEAAGDVVLLDLSAAWCAPCQSAARTAQSTQDDFEDQGFQYVTILIVDVKNDTVEQDEATEWANNFGITSAPVLQGSRDLLVSGGAVNGFPLSSWPTFILIDRSQSVAWGLYGFNEEWIRQEIEATL